jgi:hypothetical protein
LNEELPGSDPVERPPRHSVMLSATVQRFGAGPPTKHRVRDLSPGGVRIDQAAALDVGATVLVTVGALQSVGATVVWVRNGLAGLKFASIIDPDDARAKAAIAPRVAGGNAQEAGDAPTPGWGTLLKNPYRK